MHDDGRGYIYLMNGTTIIGGAGFLAPGSGWTVSHVADLDGDGKTDLVFRHADGRAHLFLMNGTTFGAGARLLGAGHGLERHAHGRPERRRQGRPRLPARRRPRARAADERHRDRRRAGDVLAAGTGWSVTQLLDLNGDGKPDLCFRNDDGRITVRLMNGLATWAAPT